MYTSLTFSGLLFVLLGSTCLLFVLRILQDWSWRCLLQFAILLMPAVILGWSLCIFQDVLLRLCHDHHLLWFWNNQWDRVFPLSIGVVVVGACLFSLLRVFLLVHTIAQRGIYSSSQVQQQADALALRVGPLRQAPRIRLCASDRPLALTYGVFRPTILLSTWMLLHLDQQEREAVLVHELGHIARRDYLLVLIATLLRDAFFYLPTSRMAYQQFQREKELACDELAVRTTRRPLALASALTKVWLHAVTPSSKRLFFGMAQSLAGVEGTMNRRIERLLDGGIPGAKKRSRIFRLEMSTLLFLILVMALSLNLLVFLVMTGCDPLSLIGSLL
jgi:beta-lactamase regulating signal transducer with metallopeptidase domain